MRSGSGSKVGVAAARFLTERCLPPIRCRSAIPGSALTLVMALRRRSIAWRWIGTGNAADSKRSLRVIASIAAQCKVVHGVER